MTTRQHHHRDTGTKLLLTAMLAAACCLSGDARALQGFKDAPQRKVESKTKNPYCEDAKKTYRTCYIPCSKTFKSTIGHKVNHCNVECQEELLWVNYLCRK